MTDLTNTHETSVFKVQLTTAPKRKGVTHKYKQFVLGDCLYLENTETGELLRNILDSGKALELGNKHNFSLDAAGRFQTDFCGVTFRIYELVLDTKSNKNLVINHIDGDPSNNKSENLEIVKNWFNSALRKTTNNLPIGVKHTHASYATNFKLPPSMKAKQLSFCSSNLNYLQNIHYKIATEAGLVTTERYLRADVQGFLPEPNFEPMLKHKASVELLILAHAENQRHWQIEGKKAPRYPDDYIELLIAPTRIRNKTK